MKSLGKAIKTAGDQKIGSISNYVTFVNKHSKCSTSAQPISAKNIMPLLTPRDEVRNRHKEAQINDVWAKTKGNTKKGRHAKSSISKDGEQSHSTTKKENKFPTKFEI